MDKFAPPLTLLKDKLLLALGWATPPDQRPCLRTPLGALAMSPHFYDEVYTYAGKGKGRRAKVEGPIFESGSSLKFQNKKLRYREKHSASVVLSWCTL